MRLAWILLVAACYHGDVPPVPVTTCAAVAEHVHALVGRARPRAGKIRDVVATRCASDAWDDEARACMLGTASLDRPRRCKTKLSEPQRRALDRDLAGLATASTAPRIPDDCRTYQALVARLGTCSALPVASRNALAQVFSDAFRNAGRDAAALGAQCKSMADGLRQAVGAVCGL